MDATVIALGPFKREIINHLEYPPECYANTREGAMIVTELFFMRTEHGSRELADVLGVQVGDFNTYAFDPAKVDAGLIPRLKRILDQCGNPEDMESFLVLRAAGFLFIFRPNS